MTRMTSQRATAGLNRSYGFQKCKLLFTLENLWEHYTFDLCYDHEIDVEDHVIFRCPFLKFNLPQSTIKVYLASSRHSFDMYMSKECLDDMKICQICLYIVSALTRFNKIAIQGTPQMTVDKEAILFYIESTHTMLSGTFPYFMCTPP